MHFEMVRIEDVIPFDKTPRRNDDAVDAVARNIHAFGFNCPIIVGPDNRICAGHTRWKPSLKCCSFSSKSASESLRNESLFVESDEYLLILVKIQLILFLFFEKAQSNAIFAGSFYSPFLKSLFG